jgi:hypothetical protein
MAKETTAPAEEQPIVTTPKGNQPPAPEMVTISKELLENLQNKLNSFEAFMVTQEDRDKPFSRASIENQKRMVKVHMYKGLPVIAYGITHKRKNEDGQPALFIEFVTEDKSLHVVNMMEYFSDESNSPWCEVIQTKTRNEVLTQGSVPATVVEWDKFSSYYSDKQVALEVVYKKNDFLVKLPDGRELWINESVIN